MSYLKELILPLAMTPKLRDLGVKAICLINFDVVEGPLAYVFEVTKGSDLIKEFERKQSRLVEIYTGLSHAPIDIVRIGSERVAVTRFEKEENGVVTTSLLLFICKEGAFAEEAERIARAAITRSRGEPRRMARAFEDAFKEAERTFVMYEKEGKILEYTIAPGEKLVKTPDEFQTLIGLVILDFERNKVDTRLAPNFIGGIKTDPVKIAKLAEEIVKEEVKKVNFITWEGQNVYVISSTKRKAALVLFSKDILGEITEEWYRTLIDVVGDKKLYADPELIVELVNYLESIKDLSLREKTRSEFIELMMSSKALMPTDVIKAEDKIKVLTPIEFAFFKDLISLYKEFISNETIYQISKNANVNLGKLIDYILFLKSRNMVSLLAVAH